MEKYSKAVAEALVRKIRVSWCLETHVVRWRDQGLIQTTPSQERRTEMQNSETNSTDWILVIGN
jgi:hypothetical protein